MAAAFLGVEELVAVDALVELEDEVLGLHREREEAVEELGDCGCGGVWCL